MTAPEAVDLGQLLDELRIERDDLLGNLRLRQADVRLLKTQLADARERLIRAELQLWIQDHPR